MLSLSPATRVFVALAAAHLRESLNGLHSQVRTVLQQDPRSGHLFVLTNRVRKRVKVLDRDGSWFWVFAKRLERGRSGWPVGEGASRLLRPRQLQLLLNGLEGRPRRGWYRT